MRTLLITAFIFLVPLSPLFAQETASVNGYVTDSETGETLIAANVALQNNQKGTSTNTSGYYTITNITPGDYTIQISYIGYRSHTENISLEEGENLRLDIELAPAGVRLDEIVVESKMEKEEQKDIGVAQVQTELIKKTPSVFEADLFRSVQLLPGVKASSDFSSGLYIRGGSPDQTLILLDRTTVYNPTHFFGFFSTFNPDAVKNVRLYKGGYPAEYGGRLGSVLTIYNKDGNRNEFAGSASVGLLASRFSIEGPLKKGSYMLAVRRSTLEPMLAILQQSQDNIPESFYFLDLNGKVNYDADPNNKFSLAFYSGIDNLRFPFADDANIKLNYGNQTLSSSWTHIFSNKVFSNLTVSGSRYFNFPSLNIAQTSFKRSNNIYDFSVKGDIEYQPNSQHLISTGFWSGIMTLKVEDTFDGEDTFSSHIQSHYTSVYAQDEWNITDQIELTAGLRLNGFSEGNYWELAPRISFEYQPSDEIRLQAAYGRYNQFLTLVTNEAFSGFDTWLTTDEGVEPAFGDQFVIGAKTLPWEGYGLDLEIYYRTMEDLFDLNPFIPDVAGLDYDQLFRFGTGYAYGAELMFERQVGRLNGFLGYTFSVSRQKYPTFNTPIGESQNARYFPPKYDRKHDLNLVMNYRLSLRWEASAVFNYSTGQAYTKPLGRTVALDFPTESQPLDALVIGKVNASRLPSYHRLDIGFTRSGSFFGIGEAQWQFQLINVYSRKNIWFYNFDTSENPIDREEVTMLPILPNISYTVNF